MTASCKRRPWTMGDVRRLLDLKRSGKTIAEISRILDRHPSSIARQYRRFGSPAAYLRLTPGREALLRDLAGRGLPASEIARRMGCSGTSIHHQAKRLGLSLTVAPPGFSPGQHPFDSEWRRRIGIGVTDHWRREAAALGWPEVTTPAQARLLSAVLSGLDTVPGLVAAGWPRRSTQKIVQRLHVMGMLERQKLDRAGYRYRVARHLLERRMEQ